MPGPEITLEHLRDSAVSQTQVRLSAGEVVHVVEYLDTLEAIVRDCVDPGSEVTFDLAIAAGRKLLGLRTTF